MWDLLPRRERIGDKVLHLVAHAVNHGIDVSPALDQHVPIFGECASSSTHTGLVKRRAEATEGDPIFLGGGFHAVEINVSLCRHAHQEVLILFCELARLAQRLKIRLQMLRQQLPGRGRLRREILQTDDRFAGEFSYFCGGGGGGGCGRCCFLPALFGVPTKDALEKTADF